MQRDLNPQVSEAERRAFIAQFKEAVERLDAAIASPEAQFDPKYRQEKEQTRQRFLAIIAKEEAQLPSA